VNDPVRRNTDPIQDYIDETLAANRRRAAEAQAARPALDRLAEEVARHHDQVDGGIGSTPYLVAEVRDLVDKVDKFGRRTSSLLVMFKNRADEGVAVGGFFSASDVDSFLDVIANEYHHLAEAVIALNGKERNR
jgi:uncharacterized protein YyaL (SSP411 family)